MQPTLCGCANDEKPPQGIAWEAAWRPYDDGHDQLFKELLRAFFREFLELFPPEVAARLDFARVTFLDKEVFTDVPEGSRRELDLVAQVHTQDGTPELILLHIEVQAQREHEFPYRMFEYYALLRLHYKVPVFPVVVYLVAGMGGLSDEACKSLLINIIETYLTRIGPGTSCHKQSISSFMPVR